MPYVTRLPNRSLLVVGGEDRRAFLQGLVSNDVNKVTAERAIWSAFLTPQGKFLWDVFIAERGDELLLETEAERIEEFRKKLSMYKLRTKVTIAVAEGVSVFAVWGEGAASSMGLPDEAGAAKAGDGTVAMVDPRLAAAGLRVYAAAAPAGAAEASFEAWDEHRIRLGLPDGSRDLPVEKAILLENGFDELNGVDFQKGCYMGQELTARTKHRGLVRKRLMPVTIDGPLPASGTPVMRGDAEAGEMRSSVGASGLALIRLEHFRQGGEFRCGDAVLAPRQPEWAVFPEGE
ncbi:MAG: YgfZ/GcvT domain-containing protein [Solirubrobacterales bacterium]